MADTGATGDLQARIEQLEARLRQLEQRERRMGAMRSLMRELVPPDVREHLRSARREQLLAFRSFIDHWIEHTERTDAKDRRENITLE